MALLNTRGNQELICRRSADRWKRYRTLMDDEIAALKANACVAEGGLRQKNGGKAWKSFLLILCCFFSRNVTPASSATTGEGLASADWKTYTRDDYGFSFSYPSDWSLWEHVNTRYMGLGLPAVFNLCLTSAPVKVLACEVDVYVVPEAKFAPPTDRGFLGLTYDANEAGTFVTKDPVSHEAWLNHYVSHNGFVYLWAHHGGQALSAPWSQMLSSFKFFSPATEAQLAEFYGIASEHDCDFIPQTPFVVEAAMSDRPHTLSIACLKKPSKNPAQRELKLTFRIIGLPQKGGYEFRWGADPFSPHRTQGLFTRNEKRCEEVLKILQSKVGARTRLAPAGVAERERYPLMKAEWRAECTPEDRWGTVLRFNLDVKPDVR